MSKIEVNRKSRDDMILLSNFPPVYQQQPTWTKMGGSRFVSVFLKVLRIYLS